MFFLIIKWYFLTGSKKKNGYNKQKLLIIYINYR